MDLTIASTAGQLAKRLDRLARSDLPYVTSVALNDTAVEVHKELGDHIDEVFDRPTRFTKGAFFIWYANKRTLRAEVKRKTMVARRHYLEVQAAGGARPQTGFEGMVRGTVKGASGVRTVTPAKGAERDSFGNVKRGQRNQIAKALQGVAPAKGRTGYFGVAKAAGLSPGVYRRDKDGGVSKVLHFSDRPARYRPAFDPQGVGEDVVGRRYADHFRRRLTEVLKAKVAGPS